MVASHHRPLGRVHEPCPRVPHGIPMGGHPSRPAVAGRLQRSTRRHRAGSPRTPAQDDVAAVPLDLAPGGVYRAAPVTRCAGGLLHHRFTLTSGEPLAVCSLWHCPAGHPGSPLATTLPCGARTFLGDGVSPVDATARPGSVHGRLAASRWAVIHLGLPLPAGSSGLPAGIGRAALERLRRTAADRRPF
jgi:hypothetical protein